ncbi:flagellar motor protein MotB [Marinomonas sp. M1K-6]|uniref:Flagellar motor protein MotB n=1 Tax=Marinomonas profundi TaxID=2726122 RepID=A0A847R2R0_9GAMM|nr:flagellar motor protein MotB [Marinomonas profundi]NLQ16613.1 flagellar motor protein MotB [Marinomonas profundi]UDV03803.1 flagellar motor protein MotB [Marinomonas profundi]
MSDEEESDCPECVEGLPAYMGTFADLMSLLVCFFVLLLTFSEMDVIKFKQLAGSLKMAFGVQREVEADSIPMGTSIIAQEFSPGRPEPTPINEVRQKVDSTPENTLEVICKPGDAELKDQSDSGSPSPITFVDKSFADLEREKKIQETEGDAQMIASVMREEISKGNVEIETKEETITIRIKDKGSFESGSAELNYAFIPVIDLIRSVLVGIQGTISVEGHTDNVPIDSRQFRSNWQLSSARAIAVAEELFSTGQLNQGRFAVTGYADTRPLVLNDSASNRATNRRVEIVIKQNDAPPSVMRSESTDLQDDGAFEFDLDSIQELRPDEIF